MICLDFIFNRLFRVAGFSVHDLVIFTSFTIIFDLHLAPRSPGHDFSQKALFLPRLGLSLATPLLHACRWRQLNFTGVGVSIGAISRFYNPIDGSGYKNWISSTTDLIARSHAHGLKVLLVEILMSKFQRYIFNFLYRKIT